MFFVPSYLFPKLAFQSLKNGYARRTSRRRSRLSTTHHTALYHTEQLEARVLLSADPGWAFQIGGFETNDGGSNTEVVRDLNTGPDGSIYLTGRFSNTVDFDPGPGTFNLTALGRTDGFIVKYTPDQQFVWAHRFGGAGHESTQRVQFDAAGNVYLIGGSSSSSIDFGPDITLTNQGAKGLFAAKLDPAGSFQWAHSWGSTDSDKTMDLAVDDAGNLHIVGQFSNTVDFDPGSASFNLISQGDTDGYLLQLDTFGNFVSAMSIGGSEDDGIGSVAIDGVGIVYLAGFFNGMAQFGTSNGSTPVVLTSAGIDDNFLMKIDANGNTEWIRQVSQVTGTGVGGLGFDGSGGVYFVGRFSGTINFDFGTLELTSAGGEDAYITKWDTGGTLVWSGQISGPEDIRASQFSFDLQGNPYFAGLFNGTVDFDPGPGTVQRTSSYSNSYVLKLDTDGNFQWVKQVDGSMFARRPISVDDAGNVYLGGNFDLRNGTAIFPTGEVLTSVGISDIFVLKLDKLGLDNTTTTYNSTDVPKALKDRKGKNPGKTDSTLTIPDSFDILDLNVQLDISHTRDEDLDVYLLGPDGTTIELFTDEGNGGGNFFAGIILDSEASTLITSGIVGTRRYKPEGDLSTFNTMNTAGTWTLQIEDDEKFQVGTLNSWSITVTHPVPPPPLPTLSIDDIQLAEGDSGTTAFDFTVTRSGDTDQVVTVDYATADGSATLADGDYVTAGGSLSFAVGETQKTISVPVNGDTAGEVNEIFFVDLFNVSANATITDSQGTGTILNDDVPPPPQTGVTVTPTSGLVTTESGGTATFTVVLDSQPTGTVFVHLVPDDLTEGRLQDANSHDQTLEFDEFNWETPQDVTVIGVDDFIIDDDIFYMILIEILFSDDPDYLLIDPDDVELLNTDDEDPMIESLAADPDPVKQGQQLDLPATALGTPQSVSFYRDSDGDSLLDVNTDEFLGTDSDNSDGWSMTVSIPGNYPTGMYTYFARGTLNGGAGFTNVMSATGEVIKKSKGKPTKSSSSSSLAAMSSSTTDSSGRSDSTSTDATVIPPTDPTLLLPAPVLIEEQPDDESATEEDTIFDEEIATAETDVDDLFAEFNESLSDDLLTV